MVGDGPLGARTGSNTSMDPQQTSCTNTHGMVIMREMEIKCARADRLNEIEENILGQMNSIINN